jgi:chromosomal replication initiation ATPase DnaA
MSTYAKTLEKAAKWASIEFERLITVQTLRAKTKAVTHTHPRWFAMAYLHATGRYSMPQIAKALHLKDHTTVLYGLRRAHGHDGKPPKQKHNFEPLWKKERFENMVLADMPESAFTFVSGHGWGIAS